MTEVLAPLAASWLILWATALLTDSVFGTKINRWFANTSWCYTRRFVRWVAVWVLVRPVRWVIRQIYRFLTSRRTWRAVWRIIRWVARFVGQVLYAIWRGVRWVATAIARVLMQVGRVSYAFAVATHATLMARWPRATLALYGVSALAGFGSLGYGSFLLYGYLR